MSAREIVVLDLETARSADDCKHCGKPKEKHGLDQVYYTDHQTRCQTSHGDLETFEPIGWNNKPALGLSIGGYYSYADDRVHWFDEHNLETTVRELVMQAPLMVSFNGIQFDFPLMRGILRRHAEEGGSSSLDAIGLNCICDCFKELAANSYDILAEIWRADPKRKFKRGLNSLDAIAQANGLGAKLSHGAQAPRDWQAGRHADVINYCQFDIYLTKWLFEMIRKNEGHLLRGDHSEIAIRWITPEGEWADPTEQPF